MKNSISHCKPYQIKLLILMITVAQTGQVGGQKFNSPNGHLSKSVVISLTVVVNSPITLVARFADDHLRPYFTTQRYASAVLATVVCPSVTRQYLSKWLNTESCKQRHKAQRLVFGCQCSLRNSNGVTSMGDKCRWVGKIGNFRQMVHDRRIVAIKVE